MHFAGFERWGDMEKAMALYEEMHAAGLAQKPYGTASYLEQFSKKLQRTIVSLPTANATPYLRLMPAAIQSCKPGHRQNP